MAPIPRRVADGLSASEKDALRQHGLGRASTDAFATEQLISLRLVVVDPISKAYEITRLGKEVLGEVILSHQ